MSYRKAPRWIAILLLTALSGCGTLSGAGPSAGTLKDSTDVEIVHVTPDLAGAEATQFQVARDDNIAHALERLQPSAASLPFVFGPGTKIGITLWSFSPRPGFAAGPGSTSLGSFTVASDGKILLPYIGNVDLQGLTLQRAQDLLARRYAALGIFQSPSVSIDLGYVPQGHILVTGAIGQPKVIAWPPEGITLAEALTQALGDGAAVLGQDASAAGHFDAVKVSVLRAQSLIGELPISVALEGTVALRPDDRIVVTRAPAVEITVLGAGVQGNGVFDFAHVPTLAEALARGAGLNANTANDHAVFVLRERDGQKPVLYDFAWNKAQGLVASHRFEMQSGDLVYVAEAPIVAIQRVINILFQAALPAQFIK